MEDFVKIESGDICPICGKGRLIFDHDHCDYEFLACTDCSSIINRVRFNG